MKKLVKITEEDLEYVSNWQKPIEEALKRVFPDQKITVLENVIRIGDDYLKVPNKIKIFMKDCQTELFARYNYKPFSFYINLVKQKRWHVQPFKDPIDGEEGWTLWNCFEQYYDGFYEDKNMAEYFAKLWNKEE